MTDVFDTFLPIILIALLIGAIVGFLIFRPRQRVRLSDSAPTRPHMSVDRQRPIPDPIPARRGHEGRGVTDEAAAAMSDLSGDILRTHVHQELSGAADNLQRLKGVGPKFATLLHSQGLFRFDQIARLTPTEVERIDAAMAAFRGRFVRDRIVEQADYLARGDEDGYQRTFGRL